MAGSNWTRDASGNFVDWTKPPYYQRGRLCLFLAGETNVHPDELRKRRSEYMKLTKRGARRQN